MTVESEDEIRELSLLDNCRTTACIGSLVCYLAISGEIARATEIYDLSDNEVQEPSLLGAALLLDGAEDKYELENACLPLFSVLHWSSEEQGAYCACRTDAERNQVVLRRMDDWARQSAKIERWRPARFFQRKTTMAQLVEPDGTPNIIESIDYAIEFCANNPGWRWGYAEEACYDECY